MHECFHGWFHDYIWWQRHDSMWRGVAMHWISARLFAVAQSNKWSQRSCGATPAHTAVPTSKTVRWSSSWIVFHKTNHRDARRPIPPLDSVPCFRHAPTACTLRRRWLLSTIINSAWEYVPTHDDHIPKNPSISLTNSSSSYRTTCDKTVHTFASVGKIFRNLTHVSIHSITLYFWPNYKTSAMLPSRITTSLI